MTKRVAIIIESSNVRGLADLPGARLDATNWRSFLMSNLGGAWSTDEINVLSKPSKGLVQALLNEYMSRYVFLAFSGHGFEEYRYSLKRYITKVCLNDTEQSVAIDEITPARLSTAVFDCCRGLDEDQGQIKLANESFSAAHPISLSATNGSMGPLSCNSARRNQTQETIGSLFLRKIDDLYIKDTVYMYSCGRDQEAGEDPSAGGYYTTLLIQGAKIWAEAQRNNSQYAVFNTKQAHAFACEALASMGLSQQPEYTPTWQSYPFAIG